VGFIDQDRVSGRYGLASGLTDLSAGHVDPNELRARSMNWADPLAARSGEAVRVGVRTGTEALIVHYVFRPDHSQQQADVGAQLPGHATALGKVLLAHNPAAVALFPARGVTSYTARTITSRSALTMELLQARSQGYAVEFGEHRPDQAGIAAPIFGSGGLTVGAVEIHGDLDRICDPSGTARPKLVAQVVDCARAVARELKTERSGE